MHAARDRVLRRHFMSLEFERAGRQLIARHALADGSQRKSSHRKPTPGATINAIAAQEATIRRDDMVRIERSLLRAKARIAIRIMASKSMGEFGVVLMVGGNIPGVTRTVSIDIFDKVQALNYSGANHTALVLLVISFLILAVVYGINRRALVALPWR